MAGFHGLATDSPLNALLYQNGLRLPAFVSPLQECGHGGAATEGLFWCPEKAGEVAGGLRRRCVPSQQLCVGVLGTGAGK